MSWQPDMHGFLFESQRVGDFHHVQLYDPDTRRSLLVLLPNPDGQEPPDHDPEFHRATEKAAAALARHVNQLPPECVSITVDLDCNLMSICTDQEKDLTLSTDHFFLNDYHLPAPVAARTVLRSELTEVRRLACGIDVVAYPPSLLPSPPRHDSEDHENRYYAFKYSTACPVTLWTEIQIIGRLPPHPHMALLDRLVLDELTGSRVVGFTMRYIANEPLDKSRGLFKLKWLRQLMQTVDDLNLKHGITHQDMAGRNLIIDPTTDSLVVIDFGVAFRAGISRPGPARNCESNWGNRDDVKGVLVFLYEYITRDPALRGDYVLHIVTDKDLMDPAKWIKHADVKLDHEVADFYFELMAWVRKRRAGKQITHHTEAPEHLDWPHFPDFVMFRTGYCVGRRRAAEMPLFEWTRPALSKLDPARRMLATGRYADEEAAAQRAAAAVLAAYESSPAEKDALWEATLGPATAGPVANSINNSPNHAVPIKPFDEAASKNGTKLTSASTHDGARRKSRPRRRTQPRAGGHHEAAQNDFLLRLRPRPTTPQGRKKQGSRDSDAAATSGVPAKKRGSRHSSPSLSARD